MGKLFTVGMVNYKCEAYIPTQLKSIFEFNDKDDFDYIIVDNNPIHDKQYWKNLKKDYDFTIIPHDPKDVNRTSGEHADGLNVLLKEAQKNGSKYLLMYDPDFFWVQKNLIKYFTAEFENENYAAIGAPYTIPLRFGNWMTPCAFGAAYSIDFIGDLDFSCAKSQHETMIEGKDVGWQIREKLSQPGVKHLTFSQENVPPNEFVGGSHAAGKDYSYEAILRQYTLYGKRIAYHLHRGSFDAPLGKYMAENWRSDRTKDIDQPPKKWVDIRQAYCNKYYAELQSSPGYL